MRTDVQINRLLKNYTNARKSWEGWCFMNNLGLKINNIKIRKQCEENILLSHCRYLLLKDVHIELYKMLKDSKNTKDSLFKYLREVDNEEGVKWIDKLTDKELDIGSILNVRDKFYAHLDEDYGEYLSDYKVDNYHEIFRLIEQSIISLGLEKKLFFHLKMIPSKDEFNLELRV